MGWRAELRGVSRTDLVCAVLIVPVAAAGIALGVQQQARDTGPATQPVAPAQETQVHTEDAGAKYGETHGWCQQRFPYRSDLQEACRWGAYEMLPGADEMPAIPAVPIPEKGQKDA